MQGRVVANLGLVGGIRPASDAGREEVVLKFREQLLDHRPRRRGQTIVTPVRKVDSRGDGEERGDETGPHRRTVGRLDVLEKQQTDLTGSGRGHITRNGCFSVRVE